MDIDSKVYRIDWICWSNLNESNCNFHGKVLDFLDGKYEEGIHKVVNMRCPNCGLHQGSISTAMNVSNYKSLFLLLINQMVRPKEKYHLKKEYHLGKYKDRINKILKRKEIQ